MSLVRVQPGEPITYPSETVKIGPPKPQGKPRTIVLVSSGYKTNTGVRQRWSVGLVSKTSVERLSGFDSHHSPPRIRSVNHLYRL
jgi:hypothetical protein